jgi:urease accessory protein
VGWIENNFATQIVRLRVDEGALVEYLPVPVIPVRNSRLYQRTDLTVHPGASARVWEALLLGRMAHGEVVAYGRWYPDFEITGEDGLCSLSTESISLQARRRRDHRAGLVPMT